MDYTSILSRNMAVMIDVCNANECSAYKRMHYERVLQALQNTSTPIYNISDMYAIVKLGSKLGKKIRFIIENNEDLPDVKEYLEHSYNESTVTTDDDSYDIESVGSNETNSETDSADGSETDSETDSADGSETDSETDSADGSETDSETDSVDGSETSSNTNDNDHPSSELVKVLQSINKIEYTILTESECGWQTLAQLRMIRNYILDYI